MNPFPMLSGRGRNDAPARAWGRAPKGPRFFSSRPTRCALLGLLLAALPAFGADKTRIAVVQLVAQVGVDPAIAVTVTGLLSGEIVSLRKFDVVDRANLDKVMREQALQQSGCSEEACAVKIGNILNVQKLVVGTVSRLGGQTIISVSFVDVERSRIELTETESASKDEEILSRIRALAKKIDAKTRISGRVLSARDDGTYLVNLGSEDGVAIFSSVTVLRYGQAVVDQATGDFLGREVVDLGNAFVVKLDPGGNLSTLKPGQGAQAFKPGDRVVLEGTQTPPPASASYTAPVRVSPPPSKPAPKTAAAGPLRPARAISSAVKPTLLVSGVVLVLGGATGAAISGILMNASWQNYLSVAAGSAQSAYDDPYASYTTAYTLTGVFSGVAGLGAALFIAGLIVKNPSQTAWVVPSFDGRDFRLTLASRF